ncbi:hypothetical protein DIPPA_20568 [Diplonema papillatum]|nr:hypothetical protein DIPPA_20568 [Diplonema papillatum]
MRPIFRGGEETMGILETQLKASRHAFTGEAWGMDLFPTYGRERAERAARWAAFDDATEKKRGKKSAVVGGDPWLVPEGIPRHEKWGERVCPGHQKVKCDVDVQDTPARRVTFAERPDDIRRLESQVERLTAMVLALVERSSPPAPQRPSVQRGMEVPPPPPLVDASRVPFGSHHAGAGHTPAPFSAPQPPAPVPAPTQPSQPAQENLFAGHHFSAPSQTEVFQQDPLDALERGSVQSQPALITPGPGLLDPRVWLSYGPVEKSLLLVHIRDIFCGSPQWVAGHEEDERSPPSSGGRGTRRQQEERVSVSVLDRFPPPPRATSGGRALLLEPPLSNGERERLVGKANSYIGDALALSTRRGVHSVYRRFLEFRRHWETRFGTPLDVPTAVVLFVTRLLSREPNSISTSTAVQYVVNIQSAERRLGRPIESQLVRDFVRSLKRAGALRPAKQAVPATKEDVARAVRLETDPVMRLAITLAWQGAARVDDVLTREARNVTESPDFWSVNWVGSKSDPFRLGQVTGVVLPPEEDETLRSLLRSARPGQRIFAGVTFRRVVAALKRSNQALTGHSLRRGALFRLLKMGVDLDTLQRVSRHATQDALDVPPPAFLEAVLHHGDISDAPPSEFTPFVTVAYGGDLIVNELAAPPAQRSSEGYLAPITSSFMDLDNLLAMDSLGLLEGVLDVIRSRGVFESALVHDASSWRSEAIARGTSRRMLHHLPDLLKYGVAEVAHEHPRVVLPAFTVPKKSGGERFVCDGRKLNAVMPRPPPMLLPSMPDVIDRVLSSAVVFLADAKSYFYQFELEEGVRGRCAWAGAGLRRASRVILPETDGLRWVDNFIIGGNSLAEAEEKFTRFARRCREVNCVLNDDEGQYGIPLTQFDLLGLRFDLASSPSRYSIATAWVEKLLRSSELADFRCGAVSPRAFYRLFGALVWFAYTTRFPLAYARCALSFVQRLSSRLSVGGLQAWDVPVTVPASTAREVESLTATIGENRWVTRVGTRGGQSIRLWSDASSKEWAALLEGKPPLGCPEGGGECRGMSFKLKLKKRSNEVVQDYCEKCGQFGHTHRDCGMGVTCYKCGKVGHHGRNCTEEIFHHSVAVQSAIDQGQYSADDALWGDKRKETGNEHIKDWKDRAAADNELAAGQTKRKRTEEDYKERETKEYALLLAPEDEARRARKEAKQLKKQMKAEKEAEEERRLTELAERRERLQQLKQETASVKQEPAGVVSCASCKATVQADAKFCQECGGKAVVKEELVRCRKCEAAVKATAKFCPECGLEAPGDTSKAAVKEREQRRTASKQEQIEAERAALAEKQLLARRAEEQKKKDHLGRVMKNKLKRQGDFFTPPDWAHPRSDKQLIVSVQRDGERLEVWDVSEHSYYLIGKNKEVVDFPMDHPSVSRIHVALVHDAAKKATYVQDLGSQWGTKIEGLKCAPKKYLKLGLNVPLTLGGSTRVLCLKERSVWE